jgi:hypothetical protein
LGDLAVTSVMFPQMKFVCPYKSALKSCIVASVVICPSCRERLTSS